MRHIIRDLDGSTSSATKLSGPIGEQLDAQPDLYRQDPVQFEPIPHKYSRPDSEQFEDLSYDQRLLLEYWLGIGSGRVDDNFVKRKPGPLNMARWLTTATRILILYTRTVNPSETLKVIVTFIVKSYAPSWFNVKFNNDWCAGPAILFDMIQMAKEVEEDVKTFIAPRQDNQETITAKVFRVLQRNAFCCLGENFLASLLFSAEKSHRQRALAKIQQIRSEPKKKVVPVKVPALNFDAKEWSELVDVSSMACHEPPCVRNMPIEEIEQMAANGLGPAFPLHSQSVERAVKLVSDASKRSYIWEKRHSFCVSTSKSRKQRPQFRTKADYV